MRFDADLFLFVYQDAQGELKPQQLAGLRFLLGALADDTNINDIRWGAYMLATVRHECAGTWQPIAEYGRGRGRAYGLPDIKTGEIYYGRGYVQLTWKNNYANMGRHFGLDLLHEPDMVMRPEVAYTIMSYGMRTGAFTGVGLPRFINQDTCDYLHARRIINGMDCAERIAGYARELEEMLRRALITEG